VGRMVQGHTCISAPFYWAQPGGFFYFTEFPSPTWRVAARAISQRRLIFLPGGNGGNEWVSAVAVSRTMIGTGNAVSSPSTFVSGRRWSSVRWTDAGWCLICGQDGAVLGSLYLETIADLGWNLICGHPPLLKLRRDTGCPQHFVIGFVFCQPEGLIAGAVPAVVGPGLADCWEIWELICASAGATICAGSSRGGEGCVVGWWPEGCDDASAIG
jgi:hypothetical protein